MAAYALELDQVMQDNTQRQTIASQWFENFTNLLAFIRDNYAVEFFAPGSLQRFEQQARQVESNLNNGFFDAVLLASQQAFQELSEFRLEIEASHAEWQLLYLTTWEAVNQEISLVENSFYVPAFDLDGNELSYLVDIDYWDPGKLDLLHYDLSEIGNRLLDQENLPDIDTLKQWLSSVIPGIHQQLEGSILDSRVKTINSQLRINVADLVVQALQEQGFALSSSAYNNYDLRQGFGARLSNLEGNEVIIQVSPTGESIGENELQIRSLDSEERTEHELQKRWQEIDNSLRSFGVNVGDYERLDVPRRSNRIRMPERVHNNPLKLTQKSG
ncbi:MAG: hypothetical protein IH586_03755 [Anaerolineaceae bacterium]|nr:hypothetical protein [Anaerolineaceae bacterium]